ncbi:allophanate hydrolase [Tamlana nanhaiensis]|uniref:Allophanate hydrolase n=1 Tax=Neotamlana nanhaiensis TaxID=1382798 RepID=A0A0D7W5H4_9FLAO|nr:5-oxoprolinase subunit PxpB [Tamlana nanhaiensis]KJD33082.1 allophanate hydrolase [Tamlana nanhaiensis]
MNHKLTYKPYNEKSILVEWPKVIDEAILNDILQFKAKIEASEGFKIMSLTHAYQSLLIHFKKEIDDFDAIINQLKDIYSSKAEVIQLRQKLWKIPVCYDSSFGIDLEFISKEKNISIEEIIERHSKAIYKVYFIGFLPGFLYLGGLDDMLATARKATPRQQIDKGSVAIGGNQTGVYPSDSPGGWNIIGKTPINFFNVNKSEPCFAKAGDCIQFYQISKEEFNDINTLVAHDVYLIESEVINA